MTIELIQSKLFNNIPNIKHGFFTRNGGVSTGIYKSLNFGFGSNDNQTHIKQNYQIAANHIGVPVENIITPYQIHSNKVIIFDELNNHPLKTKYYKGDALITNLSNIAIAVLTADCVPILLYAKDINYIAAIHAGWKGAFSGIIDNSISTLKYLRANPNNITCCILPSICQNSYEVDNIFYQNFLTSDKNNNKYFTQNNTKNFLFDLRQYVIDKLQNNGVNNIDNIATDTYNNAKLYYSYRRSTHKKEPDMGRHISFICKTK